MSELIIAPGQNLGHNLAEPAHRRSNAFGADGFFGPIRQLVTQPAVQRALPWLVIAGLLSVAALLWLALSAPSQKELLSGVNDADKSAIAAQLDSAGLSYDFDAGTGALTVAEPDFHRARMLLAAAGLPKSAPSGDTMLSTLPMGASRAVEGERLRQSREMDLARTIEAIEAVQNARVHLAVEPPSAFLRDRAQPSASVMLTLMAGRSLSDAQVQAIVHLVSSSVPGLSPEGVSVIDQNGRLMSGDSGLGGEGDRQLRVQGEVEDRYRRSITSLLTPIVGAGNFTAEVSADLDFSERQATRETFPTDEARVRQEKGKWSSDKGESPGYGIPGALSNSIPPDPVVNQTPPAATGTANGAAVIAGNPARSSEEFQRSFELGREVSVTKSAVGSVRRVSVAVALANPKGAKPRSKAEIAAIEALVRGAVGFDANRGDQVMVSARAFAGADAAATENWWDAAWIDSLARNGSALLVVIVLLAGIGIPLRKRQKAAAKLAAARESEMREAIADAVQQGGAVDFSDRAPVTLEEIAAAPTYTARADLVRQFVRQDPNRAALVVRDLLAARKGAAA